MKSKYKVDIDFNEASMLWRKNKIDLGGGMFRYRCMGITVKGEICKKRPGDNDLCYLHRKKKLKIK